MGKLSPEQREEAVRRYAGGERMSTIAASLGVSGPAIEKLLKRAGVWSRSRDHAKHIVASEIAVMAELYKTMSAAEIGAQIGRSAASVSEHLKTAGVIINRSDKKRGRIPAEIRCQFSNLYETGLSLAEVAVKFSEHGVTPTIVQKELDRQSVIRRRSGARGRFFAQPETKKIIVDKYAQGWSRYLIAQSYQCSVDAVTKVLRDSGVTVRNYDEQTGLKWADRAGRVFFMRSTWEIKTAVWLDQQLRDWDYEKEAFAVDDTGHTYTPDFWIYDQRGILEQLIDVKGWVRPESQKRIDKFREINPSLPFETWPQSRLVELGILDISLPENIELAPSFPVCVQRVSAAVEDRVVGLYVDGMNVDQTAAACGICDETVSRIIAKRGVARGKAANNLMRTPQVIRDRMAELYAAGHSIETVSKTLDVGRDIVYGEIKRRGLVRKRPRNAATKALLDNGCEIYTTGVSVAMSTAQAGTTYWQLYSELIRRGLIRSKQKKEAAGVNQEAQ